MSKPQPRPGETRQEFAQRLDNEIDEMMEEMSRKKVDKKEKKEEPTEDFDEMLRTHPAFMKSDPSPEDIENSPMLQGLQLLKYEDEGNTPEEMAVAYKEDGNYHFKKKMYSKAIKAYTAGLNKKCSDDVLNSVLYANRAASHFYLQNYRSAINDSKEALKLEPKKIKSLLRCAQCFQALEKHEETIDWAKKILAIDGNNEKANELMKQAQKSLKIAERDKRKREKIENSHLKKTKFLVDAIKKRSVKINLSNQKRKDFDTLSIEDSLILNSVDVQNPSHAKVHFEDDSIENLSENGRLIWPVLFTYPEHQISEIVEEFHEDASFDDHLDVMFGEPAPWDADNTYTRTNLEVYCETSKGIYKVDSHSSLGEVLSCSETYVKAGTPMFIILSKASPFREIFLKKYRKLAD